LTPSRSLKTYSILTPVLLAILGQVFLAQSQWPWTLWVGVVLVILCFRKIQEWPNQFASQKPSSIDLKIELFLFSLIFLVGLFFRLYRIDSLLAGLPADQGLTGLSALRILNEGWRPFNEIYLSQVPDLLLTYEMAGWFRWVGASSFTYPLFHVLISLGAFPFIYWTFRQLAGPEVALLSLFFLSVMRWNWVETRSAQPSIEVSLYLFGSLAFFLYGVKNRKPLWFFLSALFCGLGLYAYPALKIVPFLMAALAVFECLNKPKEKKIFLQTFLASIFLVLALSVPLLDYMVQFHTLGKRESESFILNEVLKEKSLSPLLQVGSGTALMFNREGDEYPLHNLPGHRMLDDGTGVLFLLGLAIAWRLRRSRECFYPLAGFFAFLLTGFLSTNVAASNRLVTLTPFVAYFAGFAGLNLLGALFKKKKVRWPFILTLSLSLLAITTQNAYTYFVLQTSDPRCQQAFGLEQNHIGKTIVQLQSANPNRFHFFIGPFFSRNSTVEFLSYQARKDFFEFQLADWAKGIEPLDKDAVLFLEAGKTGVVDFLKTLFPMSREEIYRDPEGHALLYLYFIPQESLASAAKWDHGLQGNYIPSDQWTDPAGITRLDPVLNFSSLADFGLSTRPPYRIRWTGRLLSVGGNYEFQVLTQDRGRLWLDGKPVPFEKPVTLSPGSHALRVDYEKDSGYYTQLHLVWKKPGSEKWEVVPAAAFGHVRY
jgi:hypothetical protein